LLKLHQVFQGSVMGAQGAAADLNYNNSLLHYVV